MRVDEYEIVIENRDGRPAHRLTRTTAARPMVGEEFEFEGCRFVIHRVMHRDEVTRSTRVYTNPVCYARPLRAQQRLMMATARGGRR